MLGILLQTIKPDTDRKEKKKRGKKKSFWREKKIISQGLVIRTIPD